MFARFDLREHEKATIRECSFTEAEPGVFSKIVEIIESNCPAYAKPVRPRVRPVPETAGQQLDGRFARQDPPGRRERNRHAEFAGDRFVPVPTYADHIDGLPSGGNLTLARNNPAVCSPDEKAMDELERLIVHELGIFTIFPVIGELYADRTLSTGFNNRRNLVHIGIETFVGQRESDTFKTERRHFRSRRIADSDRLYDYHVANDSENAGVGRLLRQASGCPQQCARPGSPDLPAGRAVRRRAAA